MSTEWTELFALFEQSLHDWLVRIPEPPLVPAPRPSEPAVLRLFEERLERLQTYLDQAEQEAEQVSASLTADIDALQQWLDALGAVRTKRVECTWPKSDEDTQQL